MGARHTSCTLHAMVHSQASCVITDNLPSRRHSDPRPEDTVNSFVGLGPGTMGILTST